MMNENKSKKDIYLMDYQGNSWSWWLKKTLKKRVF